VYVAHSSIASQLAASFNRKEASLSQSQTKRKAESTCSERDKQSRNGVAVMEQCLRKEMRTSTLEDW